MSFAEIPAQRGRLEVTREMENIVIITELKSRTQLEMMLSNTLEQNDAENMIRNMRPRNCHVSRFYYYYYCGDAMCFEHHRINRIVIDAV